MRNMKALVVDDSKVGRLTMQRKLEAFGIGVDLAESGLEALNYLERHRPDVIFMDHMMPDLDGFEATRRIKAASATRDIPVIIISGSDDAAFVREARAIGALDAIAKPPANEAIERILVSLPQTVAATTTGEVTPTATQPVVPTGATAHPDQTAVQAMIDAALGQLRGDWLDEFRTRLEAEFENQRQLQRAWTSRLEQRLDQATAGLADVARIAAESEALRQSMQALETRLLALESAAQSTNTPTEAWIEAVEQRVGPSFATLREGAERQAARLDELRQELLHRLDGLHARDEQVLQDLAGRIEALSEALQARVSATETLADTHSQRLESIEQRLANLEAAGPRPEVGQASLLASLETTLSRRLDDLVRDKHEHLEAELDRLRGQLQALGQSQDTLHSALSAQSEELGALLEERFAQMRAEPDAALQSAATGQEGAPQMALAETREQPSAAGIEATMAPPAAVTLPAVLLDPDLEARLAQRLTDELQGRWQAEVERLQRTVKTLTLATAAGGAALLAALLILAL